MSTDNDVIEEQKTELKRPSKYVILAHNDDVTPMDFVIELLFYVFKIDIIKATELTMKIHTEGQAAVGIYTHEIAEQKLAEANALIKLSHMQLKLTMEPE